MGEYAGKVLLISNVASLCGLTSSSYALYKELSDRYYDQGLRVLLFPCNQEPGSNQEVCSTIKAIGGKFEVFEKIDVNGPKTHPLFEFLKKKCPGFLLDRIKWNFTKFIVDRNGVPCIRFASTDNNSDGEMEKLITRLLKENPAQAGSL